MNDSCVQKRPRYSSRGLPPYSYVPGVNPHPVSHPRGHMHGHAALAAAPLAIDRWRTSEEYRYGVDLFNHGFYWEAHEAWEALWHAAGRRGPVATWLKALIKLAAAAVKLREGNARGAVRHAHRSRQLLAELRKTKIVEAAIDEAMQNPWQYCGLNVNGVDAIAWAIATEAEQGRVSPQPERLLPDWLKLSEDH